MLGPSFLGLAITRQQITDISTMEYLPEITVITPVGPTWSPSFLQSLQESLFTQDVSFEWVVSCDGSDPQQVSDVLRGDLHENIRIIGSNQNNGIAAARNRALREARGQWIYSIDADDLSLRGMVTLLQEAKGSGLSWSAGLAIDIDEKGTTIFVPPKTFTPFTDTVPLDGFVQTANATGVYPFHCCATLVRTDLVRAAGGWDEELMNVSEDCALIAEVSRREVAAWSWGFVLAYRKHADSVTTRAWDTEREDYAWRKIRGLP